MGPILLDPANLISNPKQAPLFTEIHHGLAYGGHKLWVIGVHVPKRV